MIPSGAGPRDGRFLAAALAALAILAWLLCHPYRGLFHDANLYALQALARLDPQALGHDVFLAHGSQDRFTIFSPLYAGTIALLGLDGAAALLTGLSQAGLCLAAWFLARTLLPRWAAACGVVLLLALPCDYGPLRIFSCIEPFLTPRMAAEAFTLAALAAALRGRRVPAIGLGLSGLMLHPVMAMAGLAAWILTGLLGLLRKGRGLYAAGTGAGLLVFGVAAALGIGGRFDAQWLAIVQSRSPYLFASGWHADDVTRALSGLLPLAAGALALEAPLRRACLGVLAATLCGWLMTVIGADLLHSVLLTQVQPWRIEWLTSAAGALLLPYLLVCLWQGDSGRRSAGLLLVAALVFALEPYGPLLGLAALALLAVQPLPPRYARLLLMGAAGVFALACLWRTASNLEFTEMHYLSDSLPRWLRRSMSFARDGALLGALAGAVLWLGATPRRHVSLGVALVVLVAFSAVVARFTLRDWFERDYSPHRVADFDAWRALIPPQAEVFWNGSPLPAWALLRRAHYLSGLQSSGVVFSRDAARDLEQRARRLAPVIPTAAFMDWDAVGAGLQLDGTQTRALCRLQVIDYLITTADIGLAPLAQQAPRLTAKRPLSLYRCAEPAR